MGQAYKVINTDFPKEETLYTYSEKEAAEYLELIGGSGVNSTTYQLQVIDTISGNVTGGASICYGKRQIDAMTSSLMVDALYLADFEWYKQSH